METTDPQTGALFTVRHLTTADENFIYNSWLKSYRDSPTVKSIPNTLYYDTHHKVIEGILNSPYLKSCAACNPDDPDQIYGYAIGEETDKTRVTHWVYCKHPFRNFGIGTALHNSLFTSKPFVGSAYFTHRMKTTDRLLESKRSLVYNPYLLQWRPL
jgi:hypothetical protein